VKRTTLQTLALLLPLSTAAHAQERPDLRCDSLDDFPCTVQLDGLPLKKIPSLLKVQANVAQAGLPIGEGLFTNVFVKLIRGTDTLCDEEFRNVRVVDSVINLEIGRNMSCELDEVIAENSDLSFQICTGRIDNCLKPIALGATAYAIKASFASEAAQAHHANVAGQAHYTHRMSSDSAMLAFSKLGFGYFDFATPTETEASAVVPSADFSTFANSGFLLWTPVRERAATDLHIVGRRIDSGRMTELDALYLASNDTYASGDVTVQPPSAGRGLTVTGRGAHITGDSDIDGTLRVTDKLTVLSGGAHIESNVAVHGALTVDQATRIKSDGMYVEGDSDIAGELTITQMLEVLSGGAKITGASDIDGTLLVHARTEVTSGGLAVTGSTQLAGRLDVDGRLTVSSGGLRVSSGGMRVSAGDLLVSAGGADVTGNSRVGGRVTTNDLEVAGSFRVLDASDVSHRAFAVQGMNLVLNPDKTLAETVIDGPVTFDGPVIFNGGAIDPRQPATFVLASDEDRDLTFGATFAVLDEVRLPGGITGGLTVAGGATLYGPVSIPDGINSALSVGGSLRVGGAASFTGLVSVPGGIEGNLNVTGTLSPRALVIQTTSTFEGAVSIPGGVIGNVDFGGNLTVANTGSLSVSGPTTLEGLTSNGSFSVLGAARFESPVTFVGGVTGATTFANNFTVTGSSLFKNTVHAQNGITVDGSTRFNGLVDFGGSFTGTTQFENVATSGTVQVDGRTIFGGRVSFGGGITGAVSLDSVTVGNGLTVGSTAVFNGPVDFRGEVLGLQNIAGYVKAFGETRNITLPSLTVTGNTTILGNLSLSTNLGDLTVESLEVSSSATSADFGDLDVYENLDVTGDIEPQGGFIAPNCRVCMNYADVNGSDLNTRKFACAQLRDGTNSGLMTMSGDVDGNDVFGLKILCDGGPSGTGVGEWR
jgi:hypothetical protein